MNPKYLLELVSLAAIWGASFLFMRVASPEFGSTNMAAMRIIIAGITLLPVFIVIARRHLINLPKQQQRIIWRDILLVSVGNSLVPFMLFAYAALTLEAGLTSIVNATTPLWGAFFGVVLFQARLNKSGWLGLLLGFIGVIVLTLHKLTLSFNSDVMAILAVLGATCLYGVSSNYSKRHLSNVPSLLVASGTMFVGAVIALPILMYHANPTTLLEASQAAWFSIISLGAVCTGVAYILFYRLIECTGPTIAMSVTYLIPIFGVFFGWLFLNEALYINMFFGGLLILTGISLTTGIYKLVKKPKATIS